MRVLTVANVGLQRHCSVGSSQSGVGPLELLARILYKPTGAFKRSAVSSGALLSPQRPARYSQTPVVALRVVGVGPSKKTGEWPSDAKVPS